VKCLVAELSLTEGRIRELTIRKLCNLAEENWKKRELIEGRGSGRKTGISGLLKDPTQRELL